MGYSSLPQSRHQMNLQPDPESESERWVCSTCDRIMLVRWIPEFEHVIVQPGDEYAIHSGAKGGVQIEPIAPAMSEGAEDRAARAWLAQNGIDWDGPAA